MNVAGEFLKRKFEEAGLDIAITDRPSFAHGANIFALNVNKKNVKGRSKEYFALNPGDAEVKVLDVEPDHRQLVLMVHEPERRFSTSEWNAKARKFGSVFHVTQAGWFKYLVGMDERSYFMTQLPSRVKVTTVEDAHEALKSPDVRSIETKKGAKNAKVVRQGEWFFVKATDEEVEEIEKRPVLRKEGIGGRAHAGKPHVADEIVNMANVFVRGRVRHPDHRTVYFSVWHRVFLNAEVPRNKGVRWID